jgi:catechol 2,3-dioxygenase-like lactoylglutathione lyase family enzyme
MNPFGHIDVRVKDLQEAVHFYSRWLPFLGFRFPFHNSTCQVFAAGLELPWAPYFAFSEDPEHRPNANRTAFWAENRGEVDRLAATIIESGAQNVDGPAARPEISESYYGIYFEDPWGNRFEIYHRID